MSTRRGRALSQKLLGPFERTNWLTVSSVRLLGTQAKGHGSTSSPNARHVALGSLPTELTLFC